MFFGESDGCMLRIATRGERVCVLARHQVQPRHRDTAAIRGTAYEHVDLWRLGRAQGLRADGPKRDSV